jgi:hypothetical protein
MDLVPIFGLINAETFAVTIPLLAIVGGVCIAIASIIMGARKKELTHKERVLAMEKGIEIPQAPTAERRPAYLANRSAGLVMTFLGTAITIALWAVAGKNGGVWGLIPLAIGVGLLVSAAMERKEAEGRRNRGPEGV